MTAVPPESADAERASFTFRSDRFALGLILALGLGFRLLYLTQPYLDAHGWRSADTAAIARNFYEGSMNPLYPRVDWGGRAGYVETEFPLVPYLTALLYEIFGFHDWLGRVVVIFFSLGLIAAVHRLALLLDGRVSAARAAAFLMAISPAAVFFGRTVMPDTPMLFFCVVALIGFIRYAMDGSGRALAAGSAAFGLACLAKIPALIIAVPIGAALLRWRGLKVFRDKRVWLAVVVPLLVTIAWYWHAAELFRKTGLTFGIMIHPAKTYPAWISPGPWPSVFSKWSTPELLSDPYFYERLFARLYHFQLMPVGFVLAAIGAWIWTTPGRLVNGAWLGAMLVFVLIAGEGHRAHEYYQLPFVAIGAVYFGVAARPVFDGEWFTRTLGGGAGRRAASATLLVALSIVSFYYSGVTQTHFRSGGLDARTLSAGAQIDAATPDNSLAIVVDDYGLTSPLLLYFAHLKGWSFDPGDLSPQVIQTLRRSGAEYFVTTQWDRVQRERPEAAAFLGTYIEVPLPNPPADVRVFRFR